MTLAETQDATYQIWVELKANLRRFISRRDRNEADADDILQDVFVKIHSNIGRLKDTTKLHAWIYRITRNAIADYYRSRKPELSLEESPGAFDLAKGEVPEAETEREEMMACLNPMVQRLPDDYRNAFELADVKGIRQTAVAERLSISVSGAKSRVQRARVKMKDMLLDCCHIQFDRRGRAVSMDRAKCGSCSSESC